EVVLPNGEIMEMMSELHKDNSGYNLKHLMIGAEGTLGIITAAVLRLMPKPRAYATAMLGVPSLDAALTILNALQSATGGAVEAYEYMPRFYIEKYAEHFADRQLPFPIQYDVNILVEVATTAEDLSAPDDTGQIRLSSRFEEILADQLQSGAILDAVVAQNDTQRAQMWHLRESAAEVTVAQKPLVNHDIAVPLDKVAVFLNCMQDRLAALDPGAETIVVSHLGDGNIHYPVWPKSHDPKVHAAITEAVEDVVLDLGGSFSAEHGIGRSKLPSMARRKNPVAVAVMRQIKQALDPNNILNPGKVIPPQTTKGS
ncbi:MAG: FAD-binding oxidoreductase, partial [Rhodobacteraceae bacterium]